LGFVECFGVECAFAVLLLCARFGDAGFVFSTFSEGFEVLAASGFSSLALNVAAGVFVPGVICKTTCWS